MNSHVHRFYRTFADEQAPIRLYHEVIALHDAPEISWDEVARKAPSLPKGWYELSRLPAADRIEFIRDFWVATLPYNPQVHEFIDSFFDQLDDIGVYLTQTFVDNPFEAELVYSLKDESCFYHGSPPCTEDEIEQIALEFDEVLPEDYLAFLKIHNGFSKHTDTGILKTKHLRDARRQLKDELEHYIQEIEVEVRVIDPADLIPFYESFGKPSYQCFFAAWTPNDEAGNVFYSLAEKSISDIRDKNKWQENLAFPTFLEWLVFYLEKIP